MKYSKAVLACLILVFLLISCSSIKVNNISNVETPKKDIKEVSIIASNEGINHEGAKVGSFVLKENKLKNLRNGNIDWKTLKREIKTIARQNNANLIEVNTIGYGKKGHIFYVDGNLFYTEKKIDIKKEECAIVIFRDGFESVLGSAFNINIKIDDNEFPKLKKNVHIRSEIIDCSKEVSLTVNKETHIIEFNGESRFFRVSKQTSGNPTGQSVQIGIGGTSIIEIKEKDLGRLLMFQN